MFWFLAVLIGIVAAVLIAWPLIRQSAEGRMFGLSIALIIPVVSVFLYQQVGTPEGIGVSGTPAAQEASDHTVTGAGQINEMVAMLENRLQQNPDDVQGWVLLGRTYKTVQQYGNAEAALASAAKLAPEDPLVLVELAEARLFVSGEPTINAEVRGMLERAVAIDPNQQKGVWMLGFAETQAGNHEAAIALWERLMTMLEPGSPMADTVQEQIDEARAKAGVPKQEPALPEGWQGIPLEITAEADISTLPPTAVLYVIARDPNRPNPPLGVIRIDRPSFPANARLTDANAMMEAFPVSAVAEIQVFARLSMSGLPTAQAGDLQSETVMVNTGSSDKLSLVLTAN